MEKHEVNTESKFLELHLVNVLNPIFVEESRIIHVELHRTKVNSIVQLPDDRRPKVYPGTVRDIITVRTYGGLYSGEVVPDKVDYINIWYRRKTREYWDEVNARAIWWDECAEKEAETLCKCIEKADAAERDKARIDHIIAVKKLLDTGKVSLPHMQLDATNLNIYPKSHN